MADGALLGRVMVLLRLVTGQAEGAGRHQPGDRGLRMTSIARLVGLNGTLVVIVPVQSTRVLVPADQVIVN